MTPKINKTPKHIPPKKEKKRNKPKGQKTGGSRTTVNVAVIDQVHQRGPKIQSGKNQCRVIHCELLTPIVPTPVYTPKTYSINPGNPSIFNWLPDIARNWENYIFNSLKFVYKPFCSTSVTAPVRMAVDYDVLDAPPSSATQMMNYIGATMTAAYVSSTQTCQKANLRKFKQFFVAPGNQVPTNSDWKTYFVGSFIYSAEGTVTDPIGEIWVEYDITFLTPQGAKPAAITQLKTTVPTPNVIPALVGNPVLPIMGQVASVVGAPLDAGTLNMNFVNQAINAVGNAATKNFNGFGIPPITNGTVQTIRTLINFAGQMTTGIQQLSAALLSANFGYLIADSSPTRQSVQIAALPILDLGLSSTVQGFNYQFDVVLGVGSIPSTFRYPLYAFPVMTQTTSGSMNVQSVDITVVEIPSDQLAKLDQQTEFQVAANLARGTGNNGIFCQLNDPSSSPGDIYTFATISANVPSVWVSISHDSFTISNLPVGVYYLLNSLSSGTITGYTSSVTVSGGGASSSIQTADTGTDVLDWWSFNIAVEGATATFSGSVTSVPDVDVTTTCWAVPPG